MGLKQVARKISVQDPAFPGDKTKKLTGEYLAWDVVEGEAVSLDDLILAADGVFDYSEIQRGRMRDGEHRGRKGVVNFFLEGVNANEYREALAILIPEDPYAEIRKNAKNLAKTDLYSEDEAFDMLKAKLDAKKKA